MPECRRTAEQLTPYLDDLLPEAERATVQRHLSACRPCRQAAEEADGGRTVLRTGAARLPDQPPSLGLRSRCQAAVTQTASRGPTRWLGRLAPGLAVALLVVATALVVLALATRRSNVLLAQQLTIDHVKCFHVFSSPDDPPLDATAAEQMLARRYGWNVRVPPSSADHGIVLVGARRCLYTSGPIPHVLYRVNGENMSLFMLTGEQRTTADIRALGHRSYIWSEGDTTYVLVSSEEGTGIAAAASYLMRQPH